MKNIFMTVFVISILGACREEPEDVNLPPLPSEISLVDSSSDARAKQSFWEKVAAALGVQNNKAKTEAQLLGQLATPSSLLESSKATEYMDALTGQIAAWTVEAFKTRCAAIQSVTELSSALDISTQQLNAKLYLMSYQLQSDKAGTAEDITRSGLLIIPNERPTGGAPIVGYAHAGDSGLAYPEMVAIFGKMQASHIIVAPTFPGEPLCAKGTNHRAKSCDSNGEIMPAVGTSLIWDNDVDELLGMQDCLNRVHLGLLDVTITGTSDSLKTKIQSISKAHSGGTYAAMATNIVVGASRGGLVANLALAKTGAILSSIAKAAAANVTSAILLGSGYVAPTFYSCAATLFAPSTLITGKLRLAFELMMKGNIKNSAFYQLPGVPGLDGILGSYVASGKKDDVTALKEELFKRDMTLLGPLVFGALKNWSQYDATSAVLPGKGAMALLHGTHDRVVPFTQTQLLYNVLLGQNATASVLTSAGSQGLDILTRAFTPPGSHLESNGTLKPEHLQHGDLSFLSSTAQIPADLTSSRVITGALLDPTLAAYAAAVAGSLFQTTTPSKEQISIGMNYMLAGRLKGLTPVVDEKNNINEKDAEGNAFSASNLITLWRAQNCNTAITP